MCSTVKVSFINGYPSDSIVDILLLGYPRFQVYRFYIDVTLTLTKKKIFHVTSSFYDMYVKNLNHFLHQLKF